MASRCLPQPRNIISAHFSPIMMQAALVLADGTVGMIDPSAMLNAERYAGAESLTCPQRMDDRKEPRWSECFGFGGSGK